MSTKTKSTSDGQTLEVKEASIKTFDVTQPPGNVSIVFPGSNRVQVNPTTGYPYCTIGQLAMTFPNGRSYTGTGTLINRFYVLTAAHNLYGNDVGGWASRVEFAAARNGNTFPYNPVAAAQIFVPDDYRYLSPPNPDDVPPGDVDYTRYTLDFGLVRLSAPVDAGVMRMYNPSDDELDARTFNITGYPGDKPAGTMWGADGNLGGFAEEFLFYQISTFRGQSGSAVATLFPHLQNPNTPRICGIHVAGSTRLGTNFACRLRPEVIEQVQAWMGGAADE